MLNPPTLEPQQLTSKKDKRSSRVLESKNRKKLGKDDVNYPKNSCLESEVSGIKRLDSLLKQAESDLAEKCFDDDDENGALFACGTKNGTQESAGQRILQIATIIRNLSFEEDNAAILSKNLTCLRYNRLILVFQIPETITSFNSWWIYLLFTGFVFYVLARGGAILIKWDSIS